MHLGTIAMVLVSVGGACSSSGPVQLAPTILMPEDLLMGVTLLTVSVYDPSGGLSCNPLDGTVTGLTPGTKALASETLGSSGCPMGVNYCGTISVDQTSNQRLFAAQAFVGNTSSSPVASGCTAVAPNQSTLQVTIKMLRSLPATTCNGTPSTMLTQCTTGSSADPVCDQNCQSLEELYSPGDNSSTSNTAAKVRPMLAWPAATGNTGRLFGVWGEKSPTGNQVSMRVLDESMEPFSGQGACIQSDSFRLPCTSTSPCPGQLCPTPQFNPTVAVVNTSYFVAFEDTNGVPATVIKLRQFNAALVFQSETVVSQATSTAQAAPSMAANGNAMYVAWQNGGNIVGNLVTAGGSVVLGTQSTIGPGSDVVVAASGSGWVAAYTAGSDVNLVTISQTGVPGTPMKVNTTSGANHPGVAAFGSNIAVVWADGSGNIITQRFQGTTPVDSDQVNALQDPSLGGNQKEPSVAAGSNFFVATWVDSTSGHVRARFLDGTGGFMYNWVNGQNSDFQVSTLNGDQRDNPVAVVGGTPTSPGPYVAIAWEDNTGAPSSYKGIWGRRFPLPQ